MKNYFYILFTILLFCFSACSEEEPDLPPMVEEPTEQTLELLYPTQGDVIDYCCFSFEWEDDSVSEIYRFEIANYNDFNFLLFDTIVTGKSLFYPSFLKPRRDYIWRVTALNSEVIKRDTFKIIDYPDFLRGSFEATVSRYAWNVIEGTIIDTTYQTTVDIWKGDGHTLNYYYEDGFARENIPFAEELHEGFVKYEIDHSYPANIDYFKYYFENDSIAAYHESGANGGGGHTLITGKIKD